MKQSIITSVQLGVPMNKKFWANLKKFAEVQGVQDIYAFVMNGKYKDEDLHQSVVKLIEKGELKLIDRQFNLNNKVRVYDTKVLAQNINPLAGQSNKLPHEWSYIMPGTKVRYMTVPSIGTKPRFFYSTGALTIPNYVTVARSSGMRVKRGLQALAQHQYGAVYFEDLGRGKFNIYPIVARKNGSFHYKTDKYHNGKHIPEQDVVALVLGDVHLGATNKYAWKHSLKQIDELKPKYIVLHDWFDGRSINHHTRKRLIERIRDVNQKAEILENELRMVWNETWKLAKKYPEIKFIVAESNHDLFIRTYLDMKYHHDEEHNYLQAIKIIPRIIDPNSVALKEALLTIGELPDNFIFLREGQSFSVRGWELGQHGHRGVNGSRGTANQFRRLNLRMITGHSHSPSIYENGIVVGTNTNLVQPYSIGGVSSWFHANAVVYDNGTASLLTFTVKEEPLK